MVARRNRVAAGFFEVGQDEEVLVNRIDATDECVRHDEIVNTVEEKSQREKDADRTQFKVDSSILSSFCGTDNHGPLITCLHSSEQLNALAPTAAIACLAARMAVPCSIMCTWGKTKSWCRFHGGL